MYPAWMERTERSQLKLAARRRPRSTRPRRSSSSSRTRAIPCAIASSEYGSTSRAPSPTTSGSDEMREVTTGVPQAMASSGGRPKPSYSEGKANTAAMR